MENSIMWMGLSATLLFAMVRGDNATESWTAMEQPDLKQENAPVLQTESLGEPALGVNTWEHWGSAYNALVYRLNGATYLKEGVREDIRSLIFQKDNKEIELVWNPKGEKELELKKNEIASNLYGFPLLETNTTQRLMISSQLVYLEEF